MRIISAGSTRLFGGTPARPLQIVRVTLAGPAPITVRVEGAGVSTPVPFCGQEAEPGTDGKREAEVAVAVAAPHGPGSRLPVTVIAEREDERAERAAVITVAEPGWTIWMVSHFHYDPVWWNTQGQFTQARLLLPDADGAMPDVRTAFELVRLHLDAARSDPDYKFVLAEVDYLKPYFDAHPEDRADLRALIADGRVEIVGGTYNEPNSNLTCVESAIRNIVHGLGQQRDVVGGDPSVAWALDVFGHDPSYPGLMAAAGLTGSAWARGPYHQWGPWRTVGDNARMQFPSEFEWLSPDGQGLLTSYMPNHYGAGWVIHQASDLAAAEAEALAQFALLAPVAATRNVLLPVGADHVIPARWATSVHRDLAARYVWPRFVPALPREFFAAVRAEAAERGVWLTPQTRDMNPVYPGKDVSYIDTKQAQRAAEVAVCDGERLATLAWLAGAEYPAESLDKAWRQLVFGAHHDAITGTESDQVYLDLLGGWREAFERGDAARHAAARFLAGLINTIPPNGRNGASAPPSARSPGGARHGTGASVARPGASADVGNVADVSAPPGAGTRPIVVFNTLSWPRAGVARITLEFGEPGPPWLVLRDDAGSPVPFLAEGLRRRPGGGLAELTVSFRADVPALGYRTWWASAAPGDNGTAPGDNGAAPGDNGAAPGEDRTAASANGNAAGDGGARHSRNREAGDGGRGAGWSAVPGTEIANETFLVSADPGRGGTLSQILDRRTGAELLRGPGNELLLQDEYEAHPRWGEGPWLLSPKGTGTGSAGSAATVRAQRCPAGARLVAEFSLGGLRVTQETLLWDGTDRVEFRTHVDGSLGQDRLLRVRFPADVPGGLPVYQCATAVVGRPFGSAHADVAEHPFTLDNPANEWFGLGSTARVAAGSAATAIGVAEIILPAPGAAPPADGGPSPDGRPSAGGRRAPAARSAPAGSSGADDCWQAAARGLVASLARAGVTATCTQPDGPRYGALDLDSNLPDCRIALGGPDVNPWTARLLATFDSQSGAAVAKALGDGNGARVWVPAAPSRAKVFVPSADVTGDRDLPVLIVAGPDLAAAIRALARDLADAVVEADPVIEAEPARGTLPDPALADHSVALLNRGTPSSLVSPDGTLHIALMRACSAWPCGVWIDGDRRTVPDGSSFAWQHWSHTFHYALAAGAGDWRDAGFTQAGQEYNHDLIARETGVHPGPLPARHSLGEVSTPQPARGSLGEVSALLPPRPLAMLSALKPRGNPLASGKPGLPRGEAGVTVRLRDGGGPPGPTVSAHVRLFTGIESAHVSGVCEDGEVSALPVTGDEAVAPVRAAGTVTLAIMPAAGPAVGPERDERAGAMGLAGESASPGPARETVRPGPAGETDPAPAHAEPAQPVFTRYWLHGKGPAPAGNLPVAVHLRPGRVCLPGPAESGEPGPRRRAPLRLTVACGAWPATGHVVLDVPPGLLVEGPGGTAASSLTYDLPGGRFASWDLSVLAQPGCRAGRYFVAAQIGDGLGQVLEDATLVTVGEDAPPALDQPLAALLPLLAEQEHAQTAEIELSLLPASLVVAAGERAELLAQITNRTASEIRGECQLVSPFGTWKWLGPWTRGFDVAPGAAAALAFPVLLPTGARPGARWWALAKVMYFGRVRYSECAEVAVVNSAG
jgi:alpha-mannosidase